MRLCPGHGHGSRFECINVLRCYMCICSRRTTAQLPWERRLHGRLSTTSMWSLRVHHSSCSPFNLFQSTLHVSTTHDMPHTRITNFLFLHTPTPSGAQPVLLHQTLIFSMHNAHRLSRLHTTSITPLLHSSLSLFSFPAPNTSLTNTQLAFYSLLSSLYYVFTAAFLPSAMCFMSYATMLHTEQQHETIPNPLLVVVAILSLLPDFEYLLLSLSCWILSTSFSLSCWILNKSFSLSCWILNTSFFLLLDFE